MRIEKNKPTHLSSVSQFQIFLANYFFNYLISLVIDKQNKQFIIYFVDIDIN